MKKASSCNYISSSQQCIVVGPCTDPPFRTMLPYYHDMRNKIFHKCTLLSFGTGNIVGIATGYGLDDPGSNSGQARFSAPVQTGPGAHPASYMMGTGSFPGVKSGRGVTLTPHPLLVLWSLKGRAIPLLPLWAIRPVQSLSACTRVHFTFFLYTSE